MQVVAVLGASGNPTRTAYQAIELLKQYGHHPLPIHPLEKKILGLAVFSHIGQIQKTVETLTVYVRAEISSQLTTEILQLKPKRVIFNPGAENPKLAEVLTANHIQVENACTLVLLRTGQF